MLGAEVHFLLTHRLASRQCPQLIVLFYPVFQYQTRHALKLPRIIRHQNGTDRDGMPAMAVSFGPIGVPASRRATLISVVAFPAGRSHGRIALRRAQNASTSCARRGEAFGPVAPKRISA